MRINPGIILALLCIGFLFHCEKSDPEMIAYLEKLILENKIKTAKTTINQLLTKTNNSLSEVIIETSKTQNLISSIDGQTAAWSVDDDFYYYTATEEEVQKIDLDGTIDNFTLSHSGNMAAVWIHKDDKCHLVIVDTVENSEIEPQFKQNDCKKQILISDDGHFLFGYNDKEIVTWPIHDQSGDILTLGDKKIARKSVPEKIDRKSFKAKYNKIKPNLFLNQINQRGWATFFGAGGSYKLIYYPGSGDKTQTLKSFIAKPVLYPVFEGDTLSENSNFFDTSKKSSESYLFESAQAFAYTGGAGKRSLFALVFGSGVKSGKSFKSPIWDHMQFIRDREEFMVRKKEQLYYWNPHTNKKVLLPLLALKFSLFKGGLLYLDLTGKLYIRKKPFTKMEIKLVELRQKADLKIREE